MSHHDNIQGQQPSKVSLRKNPQAYQDITTRNIPVPMNNALLIPGQGCVVFTVPDTEDLPDQLKVVFYTPSGAELMFVMDEKDSKFQYRENAEAAWQDFNDLLNADAAKIDPVDGYSRGIDKNPKCRYWVSIDGLNKRLRYGKGEMRMTTALLDYQYDTPMTLFNKDERAKYTFINELSEFKASHEIDLWTLWKDPVVAEPPVLVVRPTDFTMDMAAKNEATTITSLSKECQILYGNVADFELNTPDFPDFEQAIEYSMRTEGCLGHKILKYKIDHNQFGAESDNPYQEAYLRITLGYSQGESPGIPYVMEIWPAGCASPVHNHGYTHAIIKVLRGSIDVDLYRMLPTKFSSDDCLSTAVFHQNDITYIMPEVNQFHLLKNNLNNTDTCITIQCYSYSQDDDEHYKNFDFVENNEEGHFDPISDCDFITFKETIKKEWEDYLKTCFWKKKK